MAWDIILRPGSMTLNLPLIITYLTKYSVFDCEISKIFIFE